MFFLLAAAFDQCQTGWTRNGGFCYTVPGFKRDYVGAKTVCENNSAHIVDIQSQAENSFVNRYARRQGVGDALLLGYTDIANESTFLWERTGTSGSYTAWAYGEPNNRGQEHCTGMYLDSLGGRNAYWNDHMCSIALHFMCKKGKIELKLFSFNSRDAQKIKIS